MHIHMYVPVHCINFNTFVIAEFLYIFAAIHTQVYRYNPNAAIN